MSALASGLPKVVADEEQLSRFLTQSSQYRGGRVKPASLLPDRAFLNTSVFRVGKDEAALKKTWAAVNDANRTLHGAAVLSAETVRKNGLEVRAEEPPPRHANIERWPTSDDPELQKASQKEIAVKLAAEATLVLLRDA
jgi:hypothetical protein